MSLYFFRYSPLLLSSYARLLAILVGLLAVNFGARTLDIQQLVLVVFLFYSLYFIRLLCQQRKHTKSYLVCSFMIQHNMTASTTMFRCNFLKHWIIFFISMLNKYFFKSIHVGAYAQSCFVRAYNVEENSSPPQTIHVSSSIPSYACLTHLYEHKHKKTFYY